MEKIKILLVSLIAILAIGGIFLKVSDNSFKENKKTNVENINFSDLKKKIENKDDFVLVITQDGCSHCQNYAPIIREISEEYNIKIYDLNLTNLTKDEKDELINIANVNGTPTTLFFKNGEEESTLNRINGEASSSKLVNKLKKLGYIGD